MIRLNELAPDFQLPALDGAQVSLADFRGQNVLLVFLRHLG
jgi:peroxiredoxin